MYKKPTYKELETRFRRLEREFSDQKNLNHALKKQTYDLGIHVRTLDCLYKIAMLFERRYILPYEIFQKIADLICSAFQHPESIGARIVLQGKEYNSQNFSETSQKHSANIVANGIRIGKLEIFCPEHDQEKDKRVFQDQETDFIKSVAEQMGNFIDQRQTEEILQRYQNNLEVQMAEANDDLKHEIEVRKQTEEALRKSENKHRSVLEATPDPVAVYDTKGNVTYINPAFTRVFGWTLKESASLNTDFVPGELPETEIILSKISRHKPFSGIETYRTARDGRKVNVSISGSFFNDGNGNPMGSVLTFQDITFRKKNQEEITFIAYHDILTGLPNRKSFYKCLEEKLCQSQRRVGDDNWALLFLDLNKFKYVNDSLGHDAGDELLRTVGHRLRRCLRKTDHIFRLGGDEFTVILNNLFEDIDVANVALKIRDEVARACRIRENEIHTSVSIGISVYPDDGADVETLVKNADMAMYAAKEDNDDYRFFTEEMNRKAIERMKMGNSLRYALQNNQFVLYYQPMVDNANRITGMEALLRWRHPELGLISPEKFIPVAEDTGSIVPIGEWVLRSACRQARKWHEMGFDGLYVTVNLSRRQFKEKSMVETVEQIIRDTGLSPECLKLEVTESGIMENPEQAIAKMNILRSKGIRFSIDDFGTGYSSLGYMKRFPIDTLKIDRSFVTESMESKDDREIIRTIIAMAQNLKIETVAEGVETREQKDFLCHQGCHMMQGYYFGHPMPAREIEEILQTRDTLYNKESPITSDFYDHRNSSILWDGQVLYSKKPWQGVA